MREHRLREAQRMHSREWRKKNPDYVRLKSREYREKNPEYHRQKCREWRQRNLDYRRQYQREWRQKNPNYQRQRRLLKKTGTAADTLSSSESSVAEQQELYSQTELRQPLVSNSCSDQTSNNTLTLPNRTSKYFESSQLSTSFLGEFNSKRERGKHKHAGNPIVGPSLQAPTTIVHHHSIHNNGTLGVVVPSLDLWCPVFHNHRISVPPVFPNQNKL